VTIDGVRQWIGWYCVERPETVFEQVLAVPLRRGRAVLAIEPEMIASCEPGSLRAVSASAVGVPGCLAATVQANDAGGYELVVTAHRFAGLPTVREALVRVEGIRRGHTERWPRFSEQQALTNDEFWALARDFAVG
jgi:hypothetical protein